MSIHISINIIMNGKERKKGKKGRKKGKERVLHMCTYVYVHSIII